MSPRIVTVTLNPAVDLACEADAVVPTHKVRTFHDRSDPGGGGINVARVIHEMGGDVVALLAAGGVTGRFLEDHLDRAGITRRTVPIADLTRICMTVLDLQTELEYRFVAEGPVLSETEWRGMLAALEEVEADWVVASGSLPRGAPVDFYGQAARIASRRGQRFVLDTSQDALLAALDGDVELIKPSLGEFEYLHGKPIEDPDEQEAVAMEIARSGKARLIAVTLGSEGAILAGADFVLRMPAIQVPVRSAVGAGDSFLAAMTLAFARGASPQDALRWGTAAGAAAIMGSGTAHAKRADIEALHAQLCTPPQPR